ncbi:hypothetical protein [Bdellovibrio reynosensis]|uniref:SAF domain-containing protein n=1 Tax=Bdellovibrio reynosensis TaxID=2835041 RepID=A0ABY4CDV2_9BACT|nr:hypothetical protein [Bdellovibrio reynosensis]UOF02639.1 hypothetical protein MNR06_06710 [Bdellovibrio reynosensis]
MKTKILVLLLIVTTTWATAVSYFYWKLKNNPRVIAITMDTGKESLQQVHLGEMEKLTFLRQYLERYFNYNSNNFWQSQTSLAALMVPEQGKKRIREVSRLKEKTEQKNLSQLGQLSSLRLLPDGSYEALVSLQISEEAKSNQNLFIKTNLKIHVTERSLENPWGLLVEERSFSSSPSAPLLQPAVLVQKTISSFVTIPCVVEQIENPSDQIKIKTVTLNNSELQITPEKNAPAEAMVKAKCKEIEFSIALQQSQNQRDLYVALPLEASVARPKEMAQPAKRKKDSYDKTIENVLGIELDK